MDRIFTLYNLTLLQPRTPNYVLVEDNGEVDSYQIEKKLSDIVSHAVNDTILVFKHTEHNTNQDGYFIGFMDGEIWVRFYATIEDEHELALSFNYLSEQGWGDIGARLPSTPYANCSRTEQLRKWLENHILELRPFRLINVTQQLNVVTYY